MLIEFKVLDHHIELANAALPVSDNRNRGLICPFAQALMESFPDHSWAVGTAWIYRDGTRFAGVPVRFGRWIQRYDAATATIEGHLPVPLLTPAAPGEVWMLVHGETLAEDLALLGSEA